MSLSRKTPLSTGTRGMYGAKETFPSHLDLGAPIIATTNRIVTAVDPNTAAALTIAAQPDVPRNLTYEHSTDANGTLECNYTAVGLDMHGNVISEVVNVGPGVEIIHGTKIFAHVTSVTRAFVAGSGDAADRVRIGVGKLIGLGYALAAEADVLMTVLGGTLETNASIADINAGGVELAAVDVSDNTYDGTKHLVVVVRLMAA